MSRRFWAMRQGLIEIVVETEFDLELAAREIRRSGGSLLCSINETDGGADAEARVVHIEVRGEPSGAEYVPDTRTLRLKATAASLTGVDLLFLSYLVLESRLHRRGFMTLHAAAVEREGRSVLLLGHPGAGKTTTALVLCQRFQCRLVGNDLVVAGGLERPSVRCGTTNVRLRHSSVSRVMPELLPFLGIEPRDPWRCKVDVSPERLGICVSNEPADIAAVVFVHVDSGYPEVVVEQGDTSVHRLNLFENSLRYIRGTSTPWMVGPLWRFGPFVPCLDDTTAHMARTHALDLLLAKSHYVAGPLDSVASSVSELLRLAE